MEYRELPRGKEKISILCIFKYISERITIPENTAGL